MKTMMRDTKEKLGSRLDALQEQQMTMLEEESETLEAQVAYWGLVRQEQALLYCARQAGIISLGLCAVPPQHITKERAREAIGMHMRLQSLLNSGFGSLPWNMKETSMERLNAPPEGTFKKRGQPVRVLYDGDPNNAMQYVLWKDIFVYMEETWVQLQGHADNLGLYYVSEGHKTYYVDFASDAKKYGSTGAWTVLTQNATMYFPNSSGSKQQSIPQAPNAEEPDGPAPAPPAPTEVPAPKRARACERPGEEAPRLGSAGGGPGVPGEQGERPSTAAPGGVLRGLQLRTRPEVSEPERRPQQQRPPQPGPQQQPRPQRCAHQPLQQRHQQEQQQQQQQHQLQLQQQQQQQRQEPPLSPPPSSSPSSSPPPPPSPPVPRTVLRGVKRKSPGGPPRPTHPPRDKDSASALRPALIVSGDANQVKCLRYRWHRKHGGLIGDISTNWCWSKGGRDPHQSHICVLFDSETKRDIFCSLCVLPRGVLAKNAWLPY
nr:MAG: E2 protein [Arctocephalus gazella papillomavirus 2]